MLNILNEFVELATSALAAQRPMTQGESRFENDPDHRLNETIEATVHITIMDRQPKTSACVTIAHHAD